MLDERRNMLSQDEIVAENDRFFAPIGPTLIDFARRYYDRGTRSLKWTDKTEVERERGLVEQYVIARLKTLLASKVGEWTQVATGYAGFWSRTWTKEQVEHLQQDDRFPVPQCNSFEL